MTRALNVIPLIVLCWVSNTDAAISVGVSGPGSLTSTYEGTVSFPQNPSTGDGTITQWSINGFTPVIKTVTYGQADLDFVNAGALGSGFRWAEIVTNTSGLSWTGFQISLINTSGTFGDFLHTGIGTKEVPGFADIDLVPATPTITLLSNLGVPIVPEGWIMFLSADQKVITMDFSANPIAPGGSFEVHIPVEKLANSQGSFQLVEQSFHTPEPATLCIWAGVGLIAAGGAFRRRQSKTA